MAKVCGVLEFEEGHFYQSYSVIGLTLYFRLGYVVLRNDLFWIRSMQSGRLVETLQSRTLNSSILLLGRRVEFFVFVYWTGW